MKEREGGREGGMGFKEERQSETHRVQERDIEGARERKKNVD